MNLLPKSAMSKSIQVLDELKLNIQKDVIKAQEILEIKDSNYEVVS